MKSKKRIDLNIYEITEVHRRVCKDNGDTPSPELWHTFLKQCGIKHTSLSRIEVCDKVKYFLAKIKYGI
jgi:hypothetical protein